jgi:Ca2+-binding EF-hand superfamily protein
MSIHIDKQELDILFLYIDIDGSGSIEYKEFCRRLKRAGVVVRKKEEELIYKLFKEITLNSGMETLKEAFD